MVVLGVGKVIKRIWFKLIRNFCLNYYTYVKLIFFLCYILWGGRGFKSFDGYISYGKGERKWVGKNVFY